MILDGELGKHLYEVLMEHMAHEVEIAWYGPANDPVNMALECLTCHVVILDANKPEQEKK